MHLMKALIAGVVAGSIGAAAWAGISYATGYEIGWIAWGIGALVGIAVAWASDGGIAPGLVAVVLSLLSILAGKYAAVHFLFEREIGDEATFISENMPDLENEELVISYVADDIVEERLAQGETIEWPGGVDPEVPDEESDYPPALWSAALEQWNAMPPADQTAFRNGIEQQTRADISAFYAGLQSEGKLIAFKSSFGLMDAVFFVLAIGTAFKIAASGEVAEGAEGVEV